MARLENRSLTCSGYVLRILRIHEKASEALIQMSVNRSKTLHESEAVARACRRKQRYWFELLFRE
jgi:hypothetical protein